MLAHTANVPNSMKHSEMSNSQYKRVAMNLLCNIQVTNSIVDRAHFHFVQSMSYRNGGVTCTLQLYVTVCSCVHVLFSGGHNWYSTFVIANTGFVIKIE